MNLIQKVYYGLLYSIGAFPSSDKAAEFLREKRKEAEKESWGKLIAFHVKNVSK